LCLNRVGFLGLKNNFLEILSQLRKENQRRDKLKNSLKLIVKEFHKKSEHTMNTPSVKN